MAFHSWFASMMMDDDGIQPLFKNVESCWNQIHWSFAKHIQFPQQYNTFLGSLDIPSTPGHLLDLLCFTSDHCYTILAALHFMGQLLTLQTAMRCGKMTCFTYKLMIEILNNTVEILKFMNKFGDYVWGHMTGLHAPKWGHKTSVCRGNILSFFNLRRAICDDRERGSNSSLLSMVPLKDKMQWKSCHQEGNMLLFASSLAAMISLEARIFRNLGHRYSMVCQGHGFTVLQVLIRRSGLLQNT